MRILLVEDDESVAKALKKVLTDENYVVDVANDGQAGWHLVSTFNYDLVVLDVMLPKLNGLEFCRRLRDRSYHIPVLLVTALDSSTKKIAGLNAGADDYLTKPFELEELLARVRVLLRRVQTSVLSTLEWGDLHLDLNSREVNYGPVFLSLTPKEYGLLELFLRNPSQVFSRGAILDNLWNCSEAPGEDTVTSHIKGLRRKLTEAGAPSDLIKTVYGVGYRLKPVDSAKTQPTLIPGSNLAQDEVPESAALQQQTRAALVTLWQSVKSQHLDRLKILKQSIQALQNNCLSADLRTSATRAAHSLTGALGIFGLRSGSNLARSIEQILRDDTPIAADCRQQLSELVDALEAQLSQALSQLEASQSSRGFPLLVLINNNLRLLQQLAEALQSQGLAVQTALDESDLHNLRQNNLRQNDALPDVVLFNFSLTDIDEAALARLSELIHQIPPLLVLVGSADGSLASRVKAAQLGSHSFLQSPTVSAMLKEVLEVRSHLQQSTHKVLAVDDDPEVLKALRMLLEPKGLQLVTLNQPLDFWTTLQASSPDLLLLDMEMPEFSGIELCQAVRQAPAWNQLPIIFFTAHGDAQAKAAALRAGANDLVEKSLADSDLLVRLYDQLRRSQLQQAMATLASDSFPV
ncbi:MAG: response regulator [Cyanobacteria bacterium P01_A01_bin.114]